MKKIILFGLCFVLAVGAVFARGQRDGPQRIAIAHNLSTTSPWEIAAQAFAQYINQNSEGRFIVETFPNGVLNQGSWALALEMVQAGTIPMAIESLTAIGTLNPDTGILSLPFLFQDKEHVIRFLDSNVPVWRRWMDQFEDNGIVILSETPRPMRQLNNNVRIVRTPEDIRGMRFRVPPNPLFVEIFEALGAIPVPLPSGEIYTAIQLGTVSGEDNSIQVQYDTRTHEVAQYFTIWNYIADTTNLFINRDFFRSLSASDQDLFRRAGRVFTEVNIREDNALLDVAMRNMRAAGVQFHEMTSAEKDAFRAMVTGMYRSFETRYSPADWRAFMDGVAATRR